MAAEASIPETVALALGWHGAELYGGPLGAGLFGITWKGALGEAGR